jgi:lysophospholipid acyltransferase (LPLAT)-like uncharacterized protein
VRPDADARASEAALDSAFRRRWTPRTRARVVVLGALVHLVLRLLYATLRVRWTDPDGVLRRRAAGERFVFAAWHDCLVLLPLVLLRVPAGFRPRVLISWHRDAELAAQATRGFGVTFMRGSSTRGRIGAVRGLIDAHRAGEDLVVVPDGPRGPRHEAKPGVVQLGRATRVHVVPIALAAAPCRRLGSWDRMQVPLPFARVMVRFGGPVEVGAGGNGTLARVQAAMDATAMAAADAAGAVP